RNENGRAVRARFEAVIGPADDLSADDVVGNTATPMPREDELVGLARIVVVRKLQHVLAHRAVDVDARALALERRRRAATRGELATARPSGAARSAGRSRSAA